MDDVEYKVRTELACGEGLTLEQIAMLHGVTVEYVRAVERTMIDEVHADNMDGDNASALASAGWGTDEDYNCYDFCD
jgi:hypothetical protein